MATGPNEIKNIEVRENIHTLFGTHTQRCLLHHNIISGSLIAHKNATLLEYVIYIRTYSCSMSPPGRLTHASNEMPSSHLILVVSHCLGCLDELTTHQSMNTHTLHRYTVQYVYTIMYTSAMRIHRIIMKFTLCCWPKTVNTQDKCGTRPLKVKTMCGVVYERERMSDYLRQLHHT